MDAVIVEREELAALNQDKERKLQKKGKWKIFSKCYKILISMVIGSVFSAGLIR